MVNSACVCFWLFDLSYLIFNFNGMDKTLIHMDNSMGLKFFGLIKIAGLGAILPLYGVLAVELHVGIAIAHID